MNKNNHTINKIFFCDFSGKVFTNRLMQENFEQIIRENVGVPHKLCNLYADNPDEYEELFQEMMIQIWISLENFRGEAKVSTWIYKVCINTAMSFRTRSNNLKKKFDSLDGKIFIANEKPENNEDDERLQKLYEIIRGFKPIDRAIIGLYLEEKSYQETAEILGISKTNVATRLMRLKRKIFEQFKSYE